MNKFKMQLFFGKGTVFKEILGPPYSVLYIHMLLQSSTKTLFDNLAFRSP